MIQGRDVFMGYMGNEADTRATFDKDFRMRTGDLARVEKGFLKITGINEKIRNILILCMSYLMRLSFIKIEIYHHANL